MNQIEKHSLNPTKWNFFFYVVVLKYYSKIISSIIKFLVTGLRATKSCICFLKPGLSTLKPTFYHLL